MASSPNAAVHHHVDLVANGVDNFSELIECCARTIQLPSAVVGQDDAGTANVDRTFGVGNQHHALQAKLPLPSLDHFGHVGLTANCSMPPNVSLKGMEKPVRRSRSRLPPVMLSTVSIMTLTPASLARCIMARLSARSL